MQPDKGGQTYDDSGSNGSFSVFRFVNKIDLVPRLPDLAFSHAGHTLQMSVGGEIKVSQLFSLFVDIARIIITSQCILMPFNDLCRPFMIIWETRTLDMLVFHLDGKVSKCNYGTRLKK